MIYVITGLMASGKSTVAQQLAQSLPRCVHLRGDAFRRMIISGREDMSENPSDEAKRQLELRYQLTAQAARTYHEAGFTVVVQDNYYGGALPGFLERLKPLPVQTIVLCPDVQTIEKRERERGKRGYTGFAVQGLYDAFMQATPRIGLWIDNSHQTPEQTAEEILKHLNA